MPNPTARVFTIPLNGQSSFVIPETLGVTKATFQVTGGTVTINGNVTSLATTPVLTGSAISLTSAGISSLTITSNGALPLRLTVNPSASGVGAMVLYIGG